MRTKYDFLNGTLSITHANREKSLDLSEKVILLNNDSRNLYVNGYCIRPNKSVILSNCIIEDAENIILCNLPEGYKGNSTYPFSGEIERSWIRIYPYDETKPETKVDLFRTEQISIENVNLNFCFAKAGTNCGIHKEHGFKEFHTQVFGVGIMQKFYENSFESFNLEEFMPPGYTHEPFHYKDITYPWHQYYAVSDCVWFVAEIS